MLIGKAIGVSDEHGDFDKPFRKAFPKRDQQMDLALSNDDE
jgi:hypothetical protein